MVDPATVNLWIGRSIFAAACCFVIFSKLLPLSTEPSSIPGPDLLFVLTAVWVLRQPSHAPLLLIVVLHFLADLLFLRPPGLWSAISVFGYEFLRRKSIGPVDIEIPVEIFLVASTFTIMVIANAVAHLAFAIDQPKVSMLGLHVLITIASYPVMILIAYFGLGLRRPRPGELDIGGSTT